MSKESRIQKKAYRLSHARCEEILGSYGFQTYENESTSTLRRAIFANVLDGAIPEEVLNEGDGYA